MSLRKVERAMEFLERLGLNEMDIKVYVILIDSPLLSVGEIQQTLANVDLIKVLEAINELQDIGLVKAVEGDIKRYYANLPFLKEAVTIERETIFSLNSLITSIQEKQREIKENHKVLENVTIPSATEETVEAFNATFHKPLLSDLKVLNEAVDEALIKAHRQLDQFEENSTKTVEDAINQISETIKSLNHKIQNFEFPEFHSIKKEIEGEVTEVLKKAQNDIKVNLLAFKSSIEKAITSLSTGIKELPSFSVIMEATEQTQTQLREDKQMLQKISEELSAAIREQQANEIPDWSKLEAFVNQLSSLAKQDYSSHFDKVKETANSLESTTNNLRTKVEAGVEQLSTQTLDTLNKVGKSAAEGLERIHGEVVKALGGFNVDVSERATAIHESLKEVLASEDENISQSATKLNKIVIDNLKELQEITARMFTLPKDFIETTQESLQEISEVEKTAFKAKTTEILTKAHEGIKVIETENINLLKERIKFAKSMIEGRGADLRAVLNMSESYVVKAPVNTGIILGLPAIFATLSDLVLRSKRKVTVVTPKFDAFIFDLAVKNRSSINYTIVTAIDEAKHKKYISKAKDIGTINLYNYEGEDLYACFRDDIEMVFGYVRSGEEVSAVRSTQDSMIELFKDRFNETIIRKAKRIV